MNIPFSAWKKNKDLKNIDSLHIRELITELWNQAQKIEFGKGVLIPRKKISSPTLAKDGKIKPETLLEFLITSGNAFIYNQFAFCGKEAVDMIELKEDNRTIKSLIELKAGGSDDAYVAVYEIVYYYFVLLQALNSKQPAAVDFTQRYVLNDPLELIVLAPNKTEKKRKEAKAAAVPFLEELDPAFLPRLTAVLQDYKIPGGRRGPKVSSYPVPPEDVCKKIMAVLQPYEKIKQQFLWKNIKKNQADKLF